MQLCLDATRFGTGLDGAIELAASMGLEAVEYSFAPFPTEQPGLDKLNAGEEAYLSSISELSKRHGVEIACLNLDYCLPTDSLDHLLAMTAKLGHLASTISCPRITVMLMPSSKTDGVAENWLEESAKTLKLMKDALAPYGVRLLLRLATPPQFRGQSLQNWTAMEPQNWRDLIASCPDLSLSFSPADCVWMGIDYLKVLPGVVSGIEHIEAHDIEINRTLLGDSGMFGPLWWRYRTPGKGQVDWPQLLEALKLYDFNGKLSIHLDDEFVGKDEESLHEALAASIKLLAPLVKY